MNSFLIIESEREVIDKIQNVISNFPEYCSLGESSSYEESIEIILKESPKLVFLNLDGTIETPFSFINEINQYLGDSPEIIALSNSKEMAYDALKYTFFDYLLKPLSELDVRKSILKFKKKHQSKSPHKICLKSYKDFQYLNIDEILFLKADNNTTDFHMLDGSRAIAYKTLKTYEEVLPPNFLRIHKSYIVNTDHITRVSYSKNSCYIKKSNNNIPFTKTYSDNIESILKSLSNTSLVGSNLLSYQKQSVHSYN